jgi:hypothetical protein
MTDFVMQKFVVIERARGLSNTPYREKRVIKANTTFIIVTLASVYGIFTKDQNLIPSATKTVVQTLTNESNAYDGDDSSYAFINPSASGDVIQWDLGSVMNIIIYAKTQGGGLATVYKSYIYYSTDGSTWTLLGSDNGGTAIIVGNVSARYIKWSVNATGATYYLYTIEAYQVPSVLSKTRTFTSDIDTTISVFVFSDYSQVLEVISI